MSTEPVNVDLKKDDSVDKNLFEEIKKSARDKIKKLAKKDTKIFTTAAKSETVTQENIVTFLVRDFSRFIFEISSDNDLDVNETEVLAHELENDFYQNICSSKYSLEGVIKETFISSLTDYIKTGRFKILFEDYQISFHEEHVKKIKDSCCF